MTNLCVALLLCAVLSACDRTAHTNSPATLTALLEMAPANFATVAIARMNLLCAQGLGGADCVDLDAADGQLDAWADQVRTETDRHSYRFNRNPAEFEGSEGFFKLLMLGVVLAEDYEVHYHPELRAGLQGTDAQDGFFADPQAVFLSDLLGDERQGTCSSVPVLYLAVGRRLGYPLRLVTTKGHLFVRWEGEGERFNLEVTGEGLNRFPDDYHRGGKNLDAFVRNNPTGAIDKLGLVTGSFNVQFSTPQFEEGLVGWSVRVVFIDNRTASPAWRFAVSSTAASCWDALFFRRFDPCGGCNRS